jgi:hypothetical protein
LSFLRFKGNEVFINHGFRVLRFLVSRNQVIKVLRFQDLEVLRNQDFEVSRDQGIRISRIT